MSGAADADADVLAVAGRALGSVWGPVTLGGGTRLASSPRSRVVRATVSGAAGLPPTVVVKTHHAASSPEAGVREPAALALLGDLGCAAGPALLATGADPACVVLEDLGDHGRVSDALLWGSAAQAATAIEGWSDALARVHAATLGVERVFAAALDREAFRLGVASPATDPTETMLTEASGLLARRLPRLGVEVPQAAADELATLDALLPRDPALRALTPADACPDNNLQTADGLRLIDFESAQVRHVAWDAAYLTVPWPSCWCSWRLPDDVAQAALQRWREACAAPVLGPAFDADLRAATVGWSMASVGWFLDRAIDDEPWGDDPAEDVLAAPRRALVTHRLREVVRIDDGRLPGLTALAARALDAVQDAWGTVELPLAPAWSRP